MSDKVKLNEINNLLIELIKIILMRIVLMVSIIVPLLLVMYIGLSIMKGFLDV